MCSLEPAQILNLPVKYPFARSECFTDGSHNALEKQTVMERYYAVIGKPL